jgi:hypothetical protein
MIVDLRDWRGEIVGSIELSREDIFTDPPWGEGEFAWVSGRYLPNTGGRAEYLRLHRPDNGNPYVNHDAAGV